MVDLGVDPFVVAIILGMGVATYATKAGGVWVLNYPTVSPELEAALETLSGAIVVAIVGPELISGGPAEWTVAGVVLLVMWRTENILAALLAGVTTVVLPRQLL